jgi:hypothetical protein
MDRRVDVSRLMPIAEIVGDGAEDTRLLRAMAKDAQQYLLSFRWCKEIRRGWFGYGVGGVCAVFLFDILPDKKSVDSRLWVIAGDLPPAYLVVDESPTPRKALRNYVDLMQEWVDVVRTGKSPADCIPVNVTPSKANAGLLERRLDFIRKEILS